MCEVDDVSRTFRTRSFVVRYKDEKHVSGQLTVCFIKPNILNAVYLYQELNDGVHWRLTVPSAVLASTSINEDELTNDHIGPHCNALLHLKFELLFALTLIGWAAFFAHAGQVFAAFWSLWIFACVAGLRAAPTLSAMFAKGTADAR